MWCDDFDGDLYRLVPDARAVIAPVKDVVLFTHGHETGGTLNHPSTWNGYEGMLAFFGFENSAKPEQYVTSDPLVRCTFEEAVRDLWVHHVIMFVEGRVVWNSWQQKNNFWPLMNRARNIRPVSADQLEMARLGVVESLGDAVNRLRAILPAEG